MQKLFILLGILLILIGVLWPFFQKLGIGRLPGDIIIKKENLTFYFPIITCLIISVVLSLIFWLFHK